MVSLMNVGKVRKEMAEGEFLAQIHSYNFYCHGRFKVWRLKG